MELAAVASFAILVLAWVVAPDSPRALHAVQTPMPEPESETQPVAA